MFLPIKSFLLLEEHPSTIIKQFFKNEMNEIYLWHLHSPMSVFHTDIQAVERACNSIDKMLTSLKSIHKIFEEKKKLKFVLES